MVPFVLLAHPTAVALNIPAWVGGHGDVFCYVFS